MAIKVIAQRREVKLGKNPGKKFVMRPGNPQVDRTDHRIYRISNPNSPRSNILHGSAITKIGCHIA